MVFVCFFPQILPTYIFVFIAPFAVVSHRSASPMSFHEQEECLAQPSWGRVFVKNKTLESIQNSSFSPPLGSMKEVFSDIHCPHFYPEPPAICQGSVGFLTLVLVSVEGSAPVSGDFLYLPVFLSHLGGSGLPCDLTTLMNTRRFWLDTCSLFNFLLGWSDNFQSLYVLKWKQEVHIILCSFLGPKNVTKQISCQALRVKETL